MKPIWIVDDDQSIRFVLEKALAREELAVRSFSSGRDVMAALTTEEPQVLVSDIRMPAAPASSCSRRSRRATRRCRSSS
jgi:two-component system nitrogen regulation response regulator GlnG